MKEGRREESSRKKTAGEEAKGEELLEGLKLSCEGNVGSKWGYVGELKERGMKWRRGNEMEERGCERE